RASLRARPERAATWHRLRHALALLNLDRSDLIPACSCSSYGILPGLGTSPHRVRLACGSCRGRDGCGVLPDDVACRRNQRIARRVWAAFAPAPPGGVGFAEDFIDCLCASEV